MSDPDLHADLLRRLVRIVERVGSYRDAGVLARIVREMVGEFGLRGAAVWSFHRGDLSCECAEGEPIAEEFARGAVEGVLEQGPCIAWPLRVDDKVVGVLAACGEIAEPARLLIGMLAGRCAHILIDARRAAAQQTLLEGLGHELRAPLQALVGHVDLLRAGAFGPLTEEQSAALETVESQAEKILEVARDVLQVARIDAGHDHVIVGEVALDQLLRREVEAVRPLAQRAGIALGLECPDRLQVVSDGAKIARVVRNLLTNAIKYAPSGEVEVRGGAGQDGVFVEVADTGVGIPADQQHAVFDEYVRIDAASEGTGLGLSIARRLAEMLGGTLRLASEVGKGTTVRLELPA